MGGYGGLERSLKDEKGLCLRMNGEEEKNWGYTTLEVGHGRAILGTGRANFLDFGHFLCCNHLARPCQP
jgi:hypothetical protein